MDLTLVDPGLKDALGLMPEFDIWADLDKTRAMARQRSIDVSSLQPSVDSVSSMDYIVNHDDVNVPVRVYRPKVSQAPLPALVWIHGGGYCFGSLEAEDYNAKRMTEAVGCVVISVDYRLAPEYPFPAPLNDCYGALLWAADRALELGIDSSRIAVGGISAGGGLAAGLALLARDKGEVNVIFQALLCPMIDNHSNTASSFDITDKRIWNRHSNLQGWMHYLGRQTTADVEFFSASKYAAPSHAGDLHRLPPAYIGIGSVDLFVDENRAYADRLQQCNVSVQLEIFAGGFHGFEFFVPGAAISRLARHTHYNAFRKGLF
ncbi:MAG: alpha/beta hydrolase [Porticoccaceae bacterium]|nr:alpha/beta hydrolase [Porticoccaceae bacterium]MDG1474148.1 alpha/beta hydrolase [Porticoccaceae bacterium]